MSRKYTIALIAFLGVTALLSVMVAGFIFVRTNGHAENETPYTYVNGLQPDSALTYQVVYKPEYNGMKIDPDSPAFVEETVKADANGVARLPAMRPYYNSMTLRTNSGSQPVSLKIVNRSETGRLQISGDGFARFSEIVIGDGDKSRSSKTDWAGLFTENVPSRYNPSSENDPIKLAFSGFSLSDAPSNPAFLEVVIGQGGGPTNSGVNVYNPRIHESNCTAPSASVDGASVFRPSTCSSATMRSTIDQIPDHIVAPMMMMANQLSAVMMQQMQIIGSFFDAKEQLEAQRDFQQLMAQAHKDYHPSEQMCQIGSYVRSMSQTQQLGELNKVALNKVMVGQFSQTEHSITSEGQSLDIQVRLDKFKSTYCDPNQLGGSLWEVCRSRSFNPASILSSGTPFARDRFNKDIDYFRTLNRPLTLMIDFTNTAASTDEEDVLALARNLYWPAAHEMPDDKVFERGFANSYHLYLATRNIMSKYNVAQGSFAAIVGMKSSMPDNLAEVSGPAHMKALMRDFDLSDDDINAMMGQSPSYYAQMEFLTKKLYQHPTFYTSLYEKPANVDRINASLEAFQLMQGRDQFESMLRQEMLISVLVEQEIMKEVRDVNGVMYELGNRAKRTNPAGFP